MTTKAASGMAYASADREEAREGSCSRSRLRWLICKAEREEGGEGRGGRKGAKH